MGSAAGPDIRQLLLCCDKEITAAAALYKIYGNET